MTALTVQSRKILASPIPVFIIKEIREALPAIVFFAVGFNLIVLTTQLILDDYEAQFAGFMIATMTALVVGKAVLVAKLLPIMRRFDKAPLIQPILFQSVVYWVVVFVARFLESSSNILSMAEESAKFRITSRRISAGIGLRRSRSGYSFCS